MGRDQSAWVETRVCGQYLCGGRLWVFQVEAHGAVAEAEVRSVTSSAGHVTWLHQLAGSKKQGAMVVSKATDMLGA